jgi:hypothetical protein
VGFQIFAIFFFSQCMGKNVWRKASKARKDYMGAPPCTDKYPAYIRGVVIIHNVWGTTKGIFSIAFFKSDWDYRLVVASKHRMTHLALKSWLWPSSSFKTLWMGLFLPAIVCGGNPAYRSDYVDLSAWDGKYACVCARLNLLCREWRILSDCFRNGLVYGAD